MYWLSFCRWDRTLGPLNRIEERVYWVYGFQGDKDPAWLESMAAHDRNAENLHSSLQAQSRESELEAVKAFYSRTPDLPPEMPFLPQGYTT